MYFFGSQEDIVAMTIFTSHAWKPQGGKLQTLGQISPLTL